MAKLLDEIHPGEILLEEFIPNFPLAQMSNGSH